MPSNSLPIILSPEADEDLIEIWGYLAHEASDRLAGRQVSEIVAACTTLQTWPHSGRKRDELLAGMRSVPVHPYVVFYRIRDEAIEIVRVVHGRREIISIFAKVSSAKGHPDASGRTVQLACVC